MSELALVCWRCGASLEALTLPLSRADECRSCRAELHVCRLCRFYDTTKSRSCAEPVADEVHEKERANFCGYFEPAAGRYQTSAPATEQAKNALEALFGSKKM